MSCEVRKKIVVAIAGPTAVGKTGMAIQLARYFTCEIISADSRQFYRQMSIGTAKPTLEERAGVVHHFIDSHDVAERVTAAKFADEARALIAQLHEENDVVIAVGGSGLYLTALLEGLDQIPEVPEEVHQRWEEALEQRGPAYLTETLMESDPDYYAQVDRQNPRRLMRALSVIEHTGEKFSSFLVKKTDSPTFQHLNLFLNRKRHELYDRINLRVDQMMADGLEDEVRSLFSTRQLRSLQTVGYQELFAYFDGNCTRDEAVDKIKQHSRNYAKRQITWFRNQGNWIEVNPPDFEFIVEKIHAAIHGQ